MKTAWRKTLRLPAVEAPKKPPPANDCDLPKNCDERVPFGEPRFW